MRIAAPCKAAAALLLAASLLAGCSPDTSPRFGGKAEPYARTWANPGAPHPDTPPDRDGGKY